MCVHTQTQTQQGKGQLRQVSLCLTNREDNIKSKQALSLSPTAAI